MTPWSDDDIQERLNALAELTDEELEGVIPPSLRKLVKEHLELDRSLRRLESPVPLPVDFAVKTAEKAGVIGRPTSTLERWVSRATLASSMIVWVWVFILRWEDFKGFVGQSILASNLSLAMVTGIAASMGAIIAGLWLDRLLKRYF